MVGRKNVMEAPEGPAATRAGAGARAPIADRAGTFARICAAVAAGDSVATAAEAVGISRHTFWEWMLADQALVPAYEQALAARAEAHAEEIARIADEDPQTVEIKDKEGNVIDVKLDAAFESWRKTRIDARKWSASRLLPKRYGDRIELEHKGKIEVVPVLNVSIAPLPMPAGSIVEGEVADGGGE